MEQKDDGLLSIRGTFPSQVVSPKSFEELKAIVGSALENNLALVPVGGGTLLSMGFRPRRSDMAILLTELKGPIEYHPPDFTCSLASGTTLSEVERTLAANGQMLPLDAPFPERATVGGTLATGWIGHRAARFGSARDLCIGLKVLIGTGEEVKSGGMVVKNVTGYDLTKLHIGALGTLGIIESANFKLLPLPPKQFTVYSVFRTVEDAVKAALGLWESPARYSAVAVLSPDVLQAYREQGWCTAALWEGTPSASSRALDLAVAVVTASGGNAGQLDVELSGRFWTELRDWPLLREGSGSWASVRLRVRPADVLRAVNDFTRLADECGLKSTAVVHLPVGIVYLKVLGRDEIGGQSPIHRFLDALATCGARMVTLDYVPEGDSEPPIWGQDPPTLNIMKRIKRALDPRGLFNPGRYVGRI